MFAQIVVDVKNEHIDDYYDYLIPDNLLEFVKIGTRVLVNFGFKDILGYVINLTEESKFIDNIKPIKAVLDFEQELTLEQVDLAKYLSQEYHTSLVSTLELMIPSFLKGQKRSYLVIKDYDKLHPVLHMLFEGKQRVFMDNKVINNYNLVKKEIEKGNITLDYDLYTYGKGKKQKLYQVNPEYFNTQFKNPKRTEILKYIQTHPDVTEEMIYTFVDCSEYLLKQMVKENYLLTKEVAKIEYNDTEKVVKKFYQFNFDQTQTLNRFDNGRNNKYLLYSNDDEFKVNFYLHIIEENAKLNLPTIFITPTIFVLEDLTLFLRKRLSGFNILTFSSKNNKNDNYNTFMNVKYDNFDILITNHAGCFLPFNKIGTIVMIDEENSFYLNENYPFYDTIDVLNFRCDYHKAKLLLTSSSPSINNYYKSEMGEYDLLNSGSKIIGNVNIVSMRDSIIEGGNTVLSNKLYYKMKETLEQGKQVILYLNQKNYSPMLKCRSCGEVLRCPKCGIPLTLIKKKHEARCNYCNYTISEFTTCPKCHSDSLDTFGFGLEKVEEVVNKLFPQYNLLQIDADTMKDINEYEKAILKIEDNIANIIIGTTILAKNINNSNIGLVALLSADRMLTSNDYRANEQTYNSIAKLINSDNLIIQTYYPDNSIIKYASLGDYDSYYEEEIDRRRELEYSPFMEVNKITIKGEYQEQYHFAYYFRKVCLNIIKTSKVLGPTYDYKNQCVKLIVKHNDIEKVYKIYEDTKLAFKNAKLETSFERKPKVI